MPRSTSRARQRRPRKRGETGFCWLFLAMLAYTGRRDVARRRPSPMLRSSQSRTRSSRTRALSSTTLVAAVTTAATATFLLTPVQEARASGLDAPVIGHEQSSPSARDSAGVYWNPGQLGFLDRSEVIFGGALVIVVYTAVGGLWAVALTDLLQLTIIVIGLVILLAVVLIDVGGSAPTRPPTRSTTRRSRRSTPARSTRAARRPTRKSAAASRSPRRATSSSRSPSSKTGSRSAAASTPPRPSSSRCRRWGRSASRSRRR